MATKVVSDCLDVDAQKAEILRLLQKQLKKGDIWCLVDVRWWEQWKEYVGYDLHDRSRERREFEEAYPGPLGYDRFVQSQRGLEESRPAQVGYTRHVQSQPGLRELPPRPVRYDRYVQSQSGPKVAHPGPVNNSNLLYPSKDPVPITGLAGKIPVTVDEVSIFELVNQSDNVLREDLKTVTKLCFLLPVQAWNKLVEWYGMTAGSRPIPRVVVVMDGLYGKTLKVEIYPLWIKLGVHPHLSNFVKLNFSNGHTVGFLERVMRATFDIIEEMECRLWCRYLTRTYWLLSEPNQTLYDACPCKVQLIILEKRSADGTWPRDQTEEQPLEEQAPFPPKPFNEVMITLRRLDSQAIENSKDLLSPIVGKNKPKAVQPKQETRDLVQQSKDAESQSDTIASLQKTIGELNRSVCDKQDRITELEQAERQSARALQQGSEVQCRLTKARQEATAVQRQLTEVQHRLTEARQQTTDTQHQLAEARREAGQAQCQLAEVQRQLAESQQQAEEAHQRADDIEDDLRDAEHRLTTSDRVFQDVLQRIMGHIPQSQPFWVVQRAEVTLTDEEIGTGGWASVKVAIFRGQRVAAKCLHQQIVSAHNIRLFTREMNMAAQARHPNLLQFIGAVMEGTPIILTELLPTSLRRIMEQGTRLTRQQIVSISCDVARALNYLHLSTPDPIVHRDLSSANVLLEPCGGNWKAKVSDYGSANFVRYAATAVPGNPLYGAPEANDPTKHSPKMDVFSFGVMLVEMVAGELPDNREELIRTHMQDWPDMVRIVRACTRREPHRRPTMNELITDLKGLNVE